MKYSQIIIIFLIAVIINGCGYGQYPKVSIDSNGKIVRLSTTGDGEAPYHVLNSKKINIPHYQFDSAHYYYKKESYYQKKMNAELERLNRTGHANDISKSLLRYQDSAIKYKLLLEKCTAR